MTDNNVSHNSSQARSEEEHLLKEKLHNLLWQVPQGRDHWVASEVCRNCGELFPFHFSLHKRIILPPFEGVDQAPKLVIQEWKERVAIDRQLGNELAPSYCSVDCARQAGHRWCLTCHKKVEESCIDFCSPACEEKYRQTKQTTEAPKDRIEYANCQTCGDVFLAYISSLRYLRNDRDQYEHLRPEEFKRINLEWMIGKDYAYRFCSQACAQHAPHLWKWCRHCGTAIYDHTQLIGFCSSYCQLQHDNRRNKVERYRQKRAARDKYIDWKKRAGHRTDIEAIVEVELQKLGLNYHFEEQVGRYDCDFVLPEHKVIIECDGVYWHSNGEGEGGEIRRSSEILKDRNLELLGWIVIHLGEAEIKANASGVVRNALTSHGIAIPENESEKQNTRQLPLL